MGLVLAVLAVIRAAEVLRRQGPVTRSFGGLSPGFVKGRQSPERLHRQRAPVALGGSHSGVAFCQKGFRLGVLLLGGQTFAQGTLGNGDVVVTFGESTGSYLERLT